MANLKRKALFYVGSMVFGSVLENVGRKLSEHSKVEPEEMSTKLGQKESARLAKVQQKDFSASYFESFDPRRWQVPHVGEDLVKSVKYFRSTSNEQQKQDVQEAVKRGALKKAKELVYKPQELYKATKKGIDIMDAVHHDGEKLHKQVNDVIGQKQGEISRSLGMNMMLKAPGYLMPGIAGLMYRSYFTAKMLGNAGRQVNELSEMSKKSPGSFKQVRDERLGDVNKKN